jgi:hypothetical protein
MWKESQRQKTLIIFDYMHYLLPNNKLLFLATVVISLQCNTVLSGKHI